MKAAHHQGSYHRRSRQIVALAYANPDTRCWRPDCQLTLDEGIARYGRSGARWTAGHIKDGEIDGELRPEHHHCNSSAGARTGNQRRRRNQTSRNW